MTSTHLTLVLPCFNEGEHINNSFPRILNVLNIFRQKIEIIFVEDKSNDDSIILIKKLIKKYSNYSIRFIQHSTNQGRGQSVKDGIGAAKGKYVGYIDIDCEVSPEYIPAFVSKLEEGFDVVCGQRVYKLTPKGFIRWLASKTYSLIATLMIGVKTPDTEAGFKFFNKASILPLIIKTKDKGWFWDTEIISRSEQKGLKMISLPVTFVRRNDKTSTVRLFHDTIVYIRKLIEYRREMVRV